MSIMSTSLRRSWKTRVCAGVRFDSLGSRGAGQTLLTVLGRAPTQRAPETVTRWLTWNEDEVVEPEITPGNPTTRRYSPAEKDQAVRLDRQLRPSSELSTGDGAARRRRSLPPQRALSRVGSHPASKGDVFLLPKSIRCLS